MRPALARSTLSGCQQHRWNPPVAGSAASLRVARKRLLSLAARQGGDHQNSHDSYSAAKKRIATASAAFAAAALLLAPFPVPSAVASHLPGDLDTHHASRHSNLKAELSDLTSWLTEKLRPPEPDVNTWDGMTLYRNTVMEGVKDAASAAANMAAGATNRAAGAARSAAEAAKSAAEASGLASSNRPTDIQPSSELLSSVSKPNPAPGQGPVEAAARAEAKSELSEPALRANTLAAGKVTCCDEAEKQSTGKDTCTSRRGD